MMPLTQQTQQTQSTLHRPAAPPLNAYVYTVVGPDERSYKVTVKAATKEKADQIYAEHGARAVAVSAIAGKTIRLSGRSFEKMEEGRLDQGKFVADRRPINLKKFDLIKYFDVKYEERKEDTDALETLEKIRLKLEEILGLFRKRTQLASVANAKLQPAAEAKPIQLPREEPIQPAVVAKPIQLPAEKPQPAVETKAEPARPSQPQLMETEPKVAQSVQLSPLALGGKSKPRKKRIEVKPAPVQEVKPFILGTEEPVRKPRRRGPSRRPVLINQSNQSQLV